MPMYIRTTKVVRNRTLCFGINKIVALKRNELPIEYIGSLPHCCLDERGKLHIHAFDLDKQLTFQVTVKKGDILTKDNFHNMLAILRKCGDNLHKINKSRFQRWQGDLTFKI